MSHHSDPYKPGLPGQGFCERAVLEISSARDEPAWLRERRLEAWKIYEQLPMPTRREEFWKYSDPRELGLDSLLPWTSAAEAAGQKLSSLVLLPRERSSGLMTRVNSELFSVEPGSEWERAGVIFTDLSDAAARWPELVREWLMVKAVVAGRGKLTALHGAFFSGGAFVYVPEGVELEHPLQVVHGAAGQGAAVMPHTLVVAEKGSRVALVERFASLDVASGCAMSVVEIFAEEGARVGYLSLQDWGPGMSHYAVQRAILRRDSEFRSLVVNFGGRFARAEVESILDGEGSNSEMLGVFFADSRQHFDQRTLQSHEAVSTKSDLLYKGALKEEARAVYSGLIKIHPGAQRSDAYQANRNLVLGEKARAHSVPRLEIEANDVRCSHGATVGQLDEEQLFYLMSRGLVQEESEKLLVFGFFQEVLDRIPEEDVRSLLEAAIRQKLGA
jgi:Fe-S cluster assembly protein SufD